MVHEIEITTPRLVLRSITRSDIPAMVALVDDYEVSRWLTVVPFPYTEKDAHGFLDFLENADPFEALAIIAPEGMVGVVGIGSSLGYWLGREHHGKGYMTEAASALVDTYFQTRPVQNLESGYFTENIASKGVLEKLGFVPNGARREDSIAQGKAVTLEKVLLTRSKWAERQAILKTKRLYLRPIYTTDGPELSHRFGVPEVAGQLISFTAPWTLKDVEAWIETYKWTGKPGYRLAICLPDGRMIGTIGAYGDPLGLAYFIDPKEWQKGYVSEASLAFLADFFARFPVDQIVSTAYSDNVASVKVLEKLGFVISKHQSESSERPATSFILTRRDFEAIHGHNT